MISQIPKLKMLAMDIPWTHKLDIIATAFNFLFKTTYSHCIQITMLLCRSRKNTVMQIYIFIFENCSKVLTFKPLKFETEWYS